MINEKLINDIRKNKLVCENEIERLEHNLKILEGKKSGQIIMRRKDILTRLNNIKKEKLHEIEKNGNSIEDIMKYVRIYNEYVKEYTNLSLLLIERSKETKNKKIKDKMEEIWEESCKYGRIGQGSYNSLEIEKMDDRLNEIVEINRKINSILNLSKSGENLNKNKLNLRQLNGQTNMKEYKNNNGNTKMIKIVKGLLFDAEKIFLDYPPSKRRKMKEFIDLAEATMEKNIKNDEENEWWLEENEKINWLLLAMNEYCKKLKRLWGGEDYGSLFREREKNDRALIRKEKKALEKIFNKYKKYEELGGLRYIVVGIDKKIQELEFGENLLNQFEKKRKQGILSKMSRMLSKKDDNKMYLDLELPENINHEIELLYREFICKYNEGMKYRDEYDLNKALEIAEKILEMEKWIGIKSNYSKALEKLNKLLHERY